MMVNKRSIRRNNISAVTFILLFLALFGNGCSRDVSRVENDVMILFDGQTLNGWQGDPTYWSVQDGALVGEVTPETLLDRNSFIIWQGDMPSDFELKVEFWISATGNSGINYRSEPVEGLAYALTGYQADMDGANRYTGSNYEERRRTTLASQGEITTIPELADADQLKQYIKRNRWTAAEVTGSLGTKQSLTAGIQPEQWQEYTIICRGNRMKHFVNGVLMSDVTDNDTINRRFDGQLGVQVHVGPPMKVKYRNFRVKKL